MADVRVNAYVDGFNLYYGLKQRGWKQHYWIDPYLLVKSLLRPGYSLNRVLYFTARVRTPDDKRQRQSAYLQALQTLSMAEVILGKFLQKTVTCRNCSQSWNTHEEKMTDTAIGVNLVADAFTNDFDMAIMVGGDTDIVPALKVVHRHFPKKRLEAWFPPSRKNQQVADECDDEGQINGNHLKAAAMPERVTTPQGHVIQRPGRWTQL